MAPVFSTTPDALPHIPGYTVTEQLYTGSRTAVYRAVSTENQPVVIKVMRQSHPTLSELVHFRNQYAITQNLPIPNIIRPLGLKPWQNGYALIMEDVGSVSLQQYVKAQPLTLIETLAVGVQITGVLHDLCQHRVVHKDIKPANILIHPTSKQVKLIDFSIASLLPKEIQESQNPNNLEGTLAYLAPEQTGRMNRGIDYRTDFYGLGVTLYELLTGELPFSATDPLELVHCHIAKAPVDPQQLNGEIFPVVSQIVLKLMAKNAEDRYQSALGLKHDLDQCLHHLKDTGHIAEFELGQQDVSDRFLIPEKLYGRDSEVQSLLAAFDRVSQGNSELMLVAGFSGIGKTAVVNEVHKPITRQHGYFIKGKYDQFNRNIPFSAFVQAFRSLMGQLLSESDKQITRWKAQILNAVGENGQIIIDVIPELESIIGIQPPVPQLSGSAAQNRFNLLFGQFVQVFTQKEHPLVLFLDDLQWADSASLNLLKLLVSESNAGYLLALGAYRDNEVFPAHPLMLTLEEIQAQGATLNTLTLAPLKESDLTQLVADTLLCQTDVAGPLSQLIYQNTQGNPFFTTQSLTGLYEENCIAFDSEQGYWQCDLAQARQIVLTEDVVEFMVGRLQKLPEATQSALKLAACIGNQFDSNTLAIVCDLQQETVATNLWAGLQEGFVIPENDTYKFFQGESPQEQGVQTLSIGYRFLHDRIQQAAYSLIPDDQKQVTHLKIGQLLQQELSEQEQAQQIFSIVNQLNLGSEGLVSLEEQQALAQLNRDASQKAKRSAAYQASHTYCETGIELLSETAWDTDYDLMYGLHRDGAEAAYLAGNFDKAEALYKVTISHAKTDLDKAVIYRIQVTQYQLQGRNAEAVVIQSQSLALLGWQMPETPETTQASLDEQIDAVSRFLDQNSINSILELDKMTDENVAEMLRILQILFYTAWLSGQPSLALLAIAKMTSLSLQHGNSEMSTFGYAGYGLIANIILKNAAMADQFGDMAVQLCEQFDNADVKGMTNFLFAADVHSWSRPLSAADTFYDSAFNYGMEAGNWLTVSFVIMLSGSDRLTYGKQLDELHAIAQTHADFLKQIKSLDNLDAFTAGVLQPVRNLLGLTYSPFSFDDDNFSEADYLQKYAETPYHLVWFYSVKIRHAYLLERPNEFADLIPKLSIIENTVATHAKVPSSVFYVALMHLRLIETASNEEERQRHWQALINLEERLIQWAEDCPENIRHKCLLIQAEKARLSHQPSVAMDCYEQAITQANEQQYGYEAALANELAAKFYLAWDKIKIAAVYLQEAYYGYARWGAKAKTKQLEQTHPQLIRPILENSSQTLNPYETLGEILGSSYSVQPSTHQNSTQTNNATTGVNATLDFTALLQASQVLSSSIEFDDLIHQLTTLILQQSGADQCTLVMPDLSEKWRVQVITTAEKSSLGTEALKNNPNMPVKLIQYVKNTKNTVIINNLKTDLPVIDDYLREQHPKSILCLPLLNKGKVIGVLSLRHQSISDVFTEERLLPLNFLCSQAAISLENSRLYQMEQEKTKQLQRSEANLRSLYENAADPILILDEKTFLDCNQAAVELFKATDTSQLCGVHPADISPEFQADGQSSFEKAQAMIQQASQAGKHRFEWQHQTLTGEVFWAEVVLTPLRYKGVMVLHSIVRDISDRKAAEAKALEKSQELEQALIQLQQSQSQVVQSEKMSALGNLVAGVAHEINNPIGFLNGSIKNAQNYVQDLQEHLDLYQTHYPNATEPILENAEEIDLEFVCEDLPKLLTSMKGATDRIKAISTSLRTFSRADTEHKVSANLIEGLDSTLLILKYRLKADENRPAIQVVKEYGDLPSIDCFPGRLNQVFMNLLANAIDVFDEAAQQTTFSDLKDKPQIITVKTTLLTEAANGTKAIEIRIQDNGKGMPAEVKERIFDHLFTTKGVGKGTGLGLAIAKEIIVDAHGGTIAVQSEPGQGTEFCICLPM